MQPLCSPRYSVARGPLARAGWDDLPGELHREILRLVPLRDATAARAVSREMRDEVDVVWRAWGIQATVEDKGNDLREYFKGRIREMELDYGPVAVHVFGGSHAHHLASLGLWWLAELVTGASDLHDISWCMDAYQQSPLTVAVLARRPVGRRADGRLSGRTRWGTRRWRGRCGGRWRWGRTSIGGCREHGC